MKAAKKIKTKLTWDDLVIHPREQERFRHISNWLEDHHKRMNRKEKKYNILPGYRVLLTGSDNTDMSLIAALLGKTYGIDVYRIDLSGVFSKYIGETEKNLEKLFSKAENKGWILFFDEADALFGKRTSIKDAHDRYSNQETDILLQRIEDYKGLVIISSNNDPVDNSLLDFNETIHLPVLQRIRSGNFAPGIYVEEITGEVAEIINIPATIPAFIGYTQKAEDSDGLSLIDKPARVISLAEYEEFFGMAENEDNIIAQVVRKTENGVVQLKSAGAGFKPGTKPSLHIMYYALKLYFENGGGPCYIVSVGRTDEEPEIDDIKLRQGLEVLSLYDEPSLIVFPEGQGISDRDRYYSLLSLALKQCSELRNRFSIIDVYNQENDTTTTIEDFRNHISNENLSFGAAYYPYLKTTFNFAYLESKTDVNIITDSVSVFTRLADLKLTDPEAYNSSLDAIKKLRPVLPPSPAIAGVYVHTDTSFGIWKAPADVSLISVSGTTSPISDQEHNDMNEDPVSGKSVNAIRSFSGRGILVWGARTLDGNSNEWRYIQVRRFLMMVEETSKKATLSCVFEPNDANTWANIRSKIENYLTMLWRQGALSGSKPENAFFVKCGFGNTMTIQDINDGLLIVEIGLAAIRPAEFIIIRFTQKMQQPS